MRNLLVAYRDSVVLRDVNFDIAAPGIVLRGANGSGKSTILRVIAGLITPQTGVVQVYGREHPLDRDVVRRMSVTLDEPAFWPWLSCSATVRTVQDFAGCPDRAMAANALRDVGLEPRLRRHVGKYSQGMRKRLQVACALATDPALLLLDEPTSSLDGDGADAVVRAIGDRIVRGVTCIIATHDDQLARMLGLSELVIADRRVSS